MNVLTSIPLLSRIFENYFKESRLNSLCQRQEKPDLQELPESAPAGIWLSPLPGREVADGNTLLISWLLQPLQVTKDISEEERTLSKFFPHFLQENR